MIEEEGQLLAGELDLLYFLRPAVHPYQANAHEDGRNTGYDVINKEYVVNARMLQYIIQVIDHAKAAVGKKDGYQHEGLTGSLAMHNTDLAIMQEEKDTVGEQEQNVRPEYIGAALSGETENVKYNRFECHEQGECSV